MSNKAKDRIAKLIGVLAAILIFAVVFATVWALATTAKADSAPEMDYMELMIQAVVDKNEEEGRWAESMRNEKIDILGLPYQKIQWDDLYWLSLIVWQEAGSYNIPHEWKRDVAQVVLNRVASSEFPDTIYTVLTQPGQYSGASTLLRQTPTRECVLAALDALEGRGDMPTSVVFQANFTQGSGVHRSYYLPEYGYTYFCYSSFPGLY